MSDGPHKSLPLQRRWQDLAERAANLAFADAEVSEAMLVAFRTEFGGLPCGEVKNGCIERFLRMQCRTPVRPLSALHVDESERRTGFPLTG